MKMSNNSSRNIPLKIKGYGDVKTYAGAFNTKPTGYKKKIKIAWSKPGVNKLVNSLHDAIIKAELKDGMTISFHHHLRNGDYIINNVIDTIASMGIKDIAICTSSLTKAHEPLLKHIKSGVITSIHTSGLRGEIAKQQSLNNILGKPVVFRSHGGRVRAIEAGDVKIDIAFIGASACDEMGNMNGVEGQSAFGALTYARVDATYANKVIAITDNLKPFPLSNISIPMTLVDYVVEVDCIGDTSLIASGATRVTTNPTELLIAQKAAEVCIASGLVKNGFAFQAGSGGSSLAVCKYLRDYMIANNITGSFAAGGITSYLVKLLEEGLFNALLDTQTFDKNAVESLKKNTNHIEMSTDMYANPHNKSCTAHLLDIMILSATEIDTEFNINSLTGSTGVVMGAIGGAPDTAAGSKLTIVVAPTMRKRIPIIVDKVTTIVTPGESIDILVTERGISVNPNRSDLLGLLKKADIDTISIQELKQKVEKLTGTPKITEVTDTIVGVVEYRDGTVIDVIRQVLNKGE